MKFGLFKTTSQKYVAMLGAFTTIQNQRKSEQNIRRETGSIV